MNKKSRTYNSIFNSVVGIVTAIINVALNFAVRIVIVHALGEEINGLHSLFQNVINIISVVETSMSTAMIIHLYEPIKHDNVKELSRILSFYNRVYRVLAVGFLAIGVFLNFFLDSFITTDIPIQSVHMYFFIFTLSISISYLTYTYRVVLFATQKNRISSIATLGAEIIFRGGAALTAIFFHNYAVFLLCFIGEKLCGNLICRAYVRRKYKGISCIITNENNKELCDKVMKTVKPLLISRISDIVQNSSQSILISILLGNIAIVGYYGNYSLVVGSVGLLFSQLGASFTTSFGNLATENDKEKMYRAFRKADFIMTSIALVICSGFFVCIQDFISLAFGVRFLLGNRVVIILTVTMYVTLLNIPIISVQNATGCHDADVRNMIIQAICSVAGGYMGGKWFGIEGILIGMLIPLVFFTTICKSVIIQKKMFEISIFQIMKHIMIAVLKGISVFAVVLFTTYIIKTDSLLLNLLVKGIVTLVVSITVTSLISLRNPYLKSTVNLFFSVIGKKAI